MREHFNTFNNSCPWYLRGICEALERKTTARVDCTPQNCAPLFFTEKLFEISLKESSETRKELMLGKDKNETINNKQP